MIGSVGSFVLPSGHNPFLASERLKEIGERLHRIARATSAEAGQKAWHEFFYAKQSDSESDSWVDQQIALIANDQTAFVREAVDAGIPWDKANSTFKSLIDAAVSLRRLAGDVRMWWTPPERERIATASRKKKWSDADLMLAAESDNSAAMKRSTAIVFPAVNALDELARHIWDFHEERNRQETIPDDGGSEEGTPTTDDSKRQLSTFEELRALNQKIRERLARLGCDLSHCRPTALPIKPIMGLFATEFGWKPDDVRRLTPFQIEIYLEQLEARCLRGEGPKAENAGKSEEKNATAKAKGKRINEQMVARMARDPDSVNWSIRKWADSMGCAISTIAGLPAWKAIKTTRMLAKAERAKMADDD